MSRQTERDLTVVIRERIAKWWYYLDTAQKVSVSWLGVLVVGLIVLTAVYPAIMLVIWSIILGAVAFIGTIFALFTLFD